MSTDTKHSVKAKPATAIGTSSGTGGGAGAGAGATAKPSAVPAAAPMRKGSKKAGRQFINKQTVCILVLTCDRPLLSAYDANRVLRRCLSTKPLCAVM